MMVVYWAPTVINGDFTFPKMGTLIGNPLWPWAFEWEHQQQTDGCSIRYEHLTYLTNVELGMRIRVDHQTWVFTLW